MSATKNITRFHHQDAIYLPGPQSLAMVLGAFNLIIKKSETKEETEREEKKIVLPSHALARSPLSTQAHDCTIGGKQFHC